MYKVLFVCHGNICRSAMAEYVFKDYVKKHGYSELIHIESRATSTEEIGNPVYPNVRRILDKEGIPCDGHQAKRITYNDFNDFDIIIIFDDENKYSLNRMFGESDKIVLFTKFSKNYYNEEIDDPWYTRNFDITYKMIVDSEVGLLEYIIKIIQ